MRDAASQNMPWPNAGQLGDPLRAMVVCGRGRYAQPWLAWERICAAFGVKVGRGHVKPNFLAKNRPPDMLINCLIEFDDPMRMFGEIQIHYRPILELKARARPAFCHINLL